jgi:hypothetical protein
MLDADSHVRDTTRAPPQTRAPVPSHAEWISTR